MTPAARPAPAPEPLGEVHFTRMNRGNFARLHPLTLRLMRLHGDGHLTVKALQRYGALTPEETEQEGNFILVALDGRNRCIGVSAALGWGYRLSLVTVSRRARGQGLAGRLLRLAVQALGRYYAEVAGDNLPSLRTFFACGLRAYDVFTRPSGKVVLRLRTTDPPPEPGTKASAASAAIPADAEPT